ncbi:hypothetical protein ACVNS2_18770 [Paenibacillus caseinilyticus]|uniref:Uncharacterized protein n=1 Tax=Paenibacillus mucilaginosus K02 TaxID=997761 RepID=I0BJZ8_9BACL|nr:hypothetical protein [Paenibacillus mucilaginosus]AFH62695.1 hypothetical protein B2K_18545 [Paenibacillus mucilaginosus K02]WFA19052.1 hypothetical protein ERY13_18115 [Paenibacillus mucilaginosus]
MQKLIKHSLSVGITMNILASLYKLNVFDFSFLGMEQGSEDGYVRLWANVSFLLGIPISILTIPLLYRNVMLKKIIAVILLLFGLASIIIQGPPIFWWTLTGLGRPGYLLVDLLHIILLVMSVTLIVHICYVFKYNKWRRANGDLHVTKWKNQYK